MIFIEERKPEKIPGLSSLFIKFDYNQQLVDAIKTTEGNNYNKKTYEWESPVTNLSELLKLFSPIDNINLNLLPDAQTEDYHNIKLKEYKTKSFDHQAEAVQYGLTHNNWLLLDAPGLGKSKSIINLAEELKDRGEIEHCLVICGLNTLKSNWIKEINIHSNLTGMILGQKISKKGNVSYGGVKERIADLSRPIDEFFVITNIETLRNDDVVKLIDKGPNKFDMIAIDEAHVCKNPSSEQAHNFLKIKSGKYKIAMTGTLLLNNPIDAYVPLKFIGAEKSTFSNFKYYYCKMGGPFNNQLMGYKNLNTLKYQLESCSLRRTKELLNLPEKIVIDEVLDMDPIQQKLYDNIKDGIVSQVDKVNITTTSLLAMVSRLRQATACPSYLTTENIPATKCDRAVELTNEIIESGNKVVIFSTFKETANILAEKLKQYNPFVCTGDTNDYENSKAVDEFQNNPDRKIMIATWQKMGTGITLTAASYMIFIDTPWTSGVYEQAQDRIHRIGTKNTVFIYNLICKGTIDERVKELLDTKQAFSDYIVDDICDTVTINNLRKYIEELK